ncbi:hypothetical protein RZS08_37060, partial [Arthrospira platensis SPKY1]|nr:hypothetical protein [Arthrospira platensis SPKY1]
FGFARSVQQWQANTVDGQIQPDTLEFVGNDGYSSNSFIRNLVLGRSDLFETPVVIVSYLTISDALFVIENGARELTYNGVRYSEEAVKSGQYSLWGYQQFYNTPGLSASELVFRTALINT